jgi:mannose-6-phosphate isomerase-like protein (cupin superfamily)
MTPVRRVVTGFSPSGSSVVTADGTPSLVIPSEGGGPEVAMIWVVDETPVIPADGADPTLNMKSAFPPPGGSSFMIVTHPPGSGVSGGSGSKSELGGDVEFDESGMHLSETVDYIIVISGQVWLELDDDAEVVLSAGDVLVQNGTRHGWRNRGDVDAQVAAVLLGAHRKQKI